MTDSLIDVRCPTCGNMLYDKYVAFKKLTAQGYSNEDTFNMMGPPPMLRQSIITDHYRIVGMMQKNNHSFEEALDKVAPREIETKVIKYKHLKYDELMEKYKDDDSITPQKVLGFIYSKAGGDYNLEQCCRISILCPPRHTTTMLTQSYYKNSIPKELVLVNDPVTGKKKYKEVEKRVKTLYRAD